MRFAQELFTVTMEPDSLPYVDAAAGDIDSTVYINSVSYGRFGLLSIETNEQAGYSKELITKCCDKLFKHKSSIFTSEEESFFILVSLSCCWLVEMEQLLLRVLVDTMVLLIIWVTSTLRSQKLLHQYIVLFKISEIIPHILFTIISLTIKIRYT